MPSDSTIKMMDVLTAKVQQAKAGDYYALLDIPPEADEVAIKAAYFKAARMVHPDSLRKQALQERKDDAAFIFEKVTEAFHVLSDPNRRAAYLAARAQNKPPTPEEKGKAAEEVAKIALHQGKMLLNRRAFAQAEVCFREFVSLKPDSATGHMLLGWCLFQNQGKDLSQRLEDARSSFNAAIKLDGANADAYYYLALYFKEKGNFSEVEKNLSKALEVNKAHVPALREKRLMEMRAGQEPRQQSIGDYFKGLIGKLTKKGGKSEDAASTGFETKKK
jgi:curved DNA-binding protein CbpA